MKKTISLILVAVLAVLLSACRSSRHATTDQTTVVHTQPKLQASGANALAAKLDLSLEAGSKRVNVGGNYRLKRNEVVQINLTYTMLFTISVGTMELTPDYILILDRINKRYCRIAYSDVPDLQRAGIDFDFLQRIFWGEAEPSPTKIISWTYDQWTDFGKGKFPGQICFTLSTGGKSYKATLALSNLRESADWDTRTDISQKYTSVSFDTVMKALLNAAK